MLNLPSQIIDFQPFIELKESDPKTIVVTLLKACGDMKVIACIASFFIGIFFIGIDTVYTPMMKSIGVKDQSISQQKAAIEKKQQQKRQFEQWERDVATVGTRMVRLKAEQSAQVISLKESEKVVSIAKSQQSALPDPHNKREAVALAKVQNQIMAIINGQTSSATDAPPPPAEGEMGAGGPGNEELPPTVNVERYTYKLTLSGTYPAVVDFINKLVTLENLVAIDEIIIERTDKEGLTLPDPEKFPEYPVKVNLSLVFSIYLYVPEGAAAGG